MARTLRQKKVARRLMEAIENGETISKGQLLKDTGYSVSSQNQPKRILEADGVLEELEEAGFSETKAKSVLAGILNAPTIFEMVTPENQIKAAQEVFKVRGSYAATKTFSESRNLNVEVNAKGNEELQKLAMLVREQMKKELLDEI